MVTAFKKVVNRGVSTLAAGITDSDLTLTVATGEGALFPLTDFRFTIEDERLTCSSRTGDVFTIVRAQESSSAAAHAISVRVAANITAEHISDLNTAVNAIENTAPSARADQAAREAETDEDTFVSPDLVNFSPGVAKGWVRFDGTTTGPVTLNASHNVTSVIDDAVGRYDVNWATNFSSANYAVAMQGPNGIISYEGFSAAPTAGITEIITKNTSDVDTDAGRQYCVAFGDQ